MCQFTLIQNKAVSYEYGEMAEWLTKLTGSILNINSFFVDGPKGEGRTARITRDWSAMCQFTLIQNKAVSFEYGEMAEWLKALPC